jgi:microcystin-dependent protein
MPNTLTPNMSLILPTVGQEPGPNWALDINSSFSILDQHNHSNGNGVQIIPSGLNINSDLTFLGNNATNLRSTRFSVQLSPLALASDIGCIYVSGADLYYNDTLGNQVRLTIAGAVNGTPGSIGGLIAPASVTYVPGNQTYVFQSAVNTSGSLDVGPLTIRNVTASSNGITITPPSPLASNYTITLPANAPASQGIVEMNSSGVINVSPHSYQSLCPVGSVIDFAGNSAPTGWLVCDGSAVSRTTYSDLFSAIGTLWGSGDGINTFNLPNLRRKTTIGAGGTGSVTIGNSVGNIGGEENHILSTSEIPSHTHNATTASAGSHKHDFTVVTTPIGSGQMGYNLSVDNKQNTALIDTAYQSSAGSHTHVLTVDPIGGGSGHNTMQPSAVMNKIIKF